MTVSVQTKAFINGEWCASQTGETFQVLNPATGEVEATVADCNGDDTKLAISAAKTAFTTWRKTLPRQKSSILLKIEAKLMENQERLGELLTRENGKPIGEAKGEVGFAASFFGWYAGEARREYGDYVPSPVSSKEMLHIREPLGVAGLITPWNFPIGMLARKVGAALAAGCTCVLKPAEDTPLVALAFAEIVSDLLPKGVFNVVPSSRKNAPSIGEEFCVNKDVDAISFTGSTQVGKWLQTKCGSSVKRIALELGGNAPFIVFKSANMDEAVEGAMASKFRNTGQTCVTANRIFVASEVHDEFVAKFKKAMENNLKVGNGLESGNNQGPLINERQHQRLVSLVKSGLDEGCELLLGGLDPHPLGKTYFKPTLMIGGKPTMEICKEEIFGPVAVIIKFETEEEVVQLANDTNRGLAGYFYSQDLSQIWRVSKALESGMVGVNEAMVSTCEAAFGGYKESGIGIEGSKYGIHEYSKLKFICMGNIKQ